MPCQLFSNSITSLRPQGLCLFCFLLEMGHSAFSVERKNAWIKNTLKSLVSRGFWLYWLKLSQSIWLAFCRLTSGVLSSTWILLFGILLFICCGMESIGVRSLISTKSCYIDQALLEFTVVLQPQPQPPKFWNYRHDPLCLGNGGFLCGNTDLNSEG